MVGGGGGHCVMMTGASWQAGRWGVAAFQARLPHELASPGPCRVNTINGRAYKDDPTIFAWVRVACSPCSSSSLPTDWSAIAAVAPRCHDCGWRLAARSMETLAA